ncbi:NAD(P)/FAD-dependent oxidoreductase [Thiomicrorhabdus sp. 6S2-11]|uniref:NAD(P)/FAD-dependent oxidoreductase n=1 Tax=Thiomicrorhabdus marina TaxID=2818442 RepID=A0ABS3Q1G2_9GAMM|nr:FAD-dependent oxidoreductase [Thiomicrorhabdus marina]MBO1926147.1 NAD(P)/FAD-dependent oxidoreductase [Thiomicrorhabdus marina]
MSSLNEKPKLIMVGAGMAGMRFLDELLALSQAYQITVFNREPHGGYNRIMLSPVLAGEKTLEEIITHDSDWFAANDITLHTHCSISRIDAKSQIIITEQGEDFNYDRLIIATGSNPFVLPIANTDLAGVVSFREIADVELMQKAAAGGKQAVVIGGGLLGLEAAYGLQKQGMQVAVVHRSSILMNAQLDARAGEILQSELSNATPQRAGMQFYMQSEVAEIIANLTGTHIQAVRLKDGREIACDLLVMAIGIRPNIVLAESAGLASNRGILVNDQLETNIANIYALGECVEHNGHTYGLVAPLYQQAKVLAQILASKVGDYQAEVLPAYQGSLTSTMLKVTGINLFSAGEFNGMEDAETLVFTDAAQNIYRKLVIANQRIIGAVLYGDTYAANWFFELLKQRTDISQCKDTLLFGEGFSN